jgi:hypothetical protein
MLEISFDDIRDWYQDQLESRSKNYIAGISTVLTKITAALLSLSNSIQEFPLIAGEDENVHSRTAAEKLTNELNNQVNSINEPIDPIAFRDIEDYIKSLSAFLKNSTWTARKYVPKLGRSYRNVVRTTDGFLKSVNKHAVTLHKFHTSYTWLGKAEDVFQKITIMEEASSKLIEIEETLEQVQRKLDQEMEKVEAIEKKILAFKQEANVSKFLSVESDLEVIQKQANDNLDVLAKPLEKLTRDGKYTFPGVQGSILHDLVSSPIEFLSKETTKIEDVKSALKTLAKALSTVEINYAKPKIRRAIKRIERITANEDLETIKAQSHNLLTEKKEVENKVDFTTEDQLRGDLERAKKDVQYTQERLEKVKLDEDRISQKIQIQRKTLNKDIYTAIKEKVNVTLE